MQLGIGRCEHSSHMVSFCLSVDYLKDPLKLFSFAVQGISRVCAIRAEILPAFLTYLGALHHLHVLHLGIYA